MSRRQEMLPVPPLPRGAWEWAYSRDLFGRVDRPNEKVWPIREWLERLVEEIGDGASRAEHAHFDSGVPAAEHTCWRVLFAKIAALGLKGLAEYDAEFYRLGEQPPAFDPEVPGINWDDEEEAETYESYFGPTDEPTAPMDCGFEVGDATAEIRDCDCPQEHRRVKPGTDYITCRLCGAYHDEDQ